MTPPAAGFVLPPDALAMPWATVIDDLRARHGQAVDLALSPDCTDPDAAPDALPEEIASPVAGSTDASWLRRRNIVGINVRTVGDLAGVVKYALTLPTHVDGVHLLPLWEPGAVGSLYGMASWNLNPAFRSPELVDAHPHLTSTARQVRAVVNLLHVMGKAVGMDVIPHTDRFSEQVLANPDLFEWMRIDDARIADWSDAVTDSATDLITAWYADSGPASADVHPNDLHVVDEATRLLALFGLPGDHAGRLDRRVALIHRLKRKGFETVPATMGVPFRGIEVDDDPARVVVDDAGLVWRDFVFVQPESMSRVFSPLTRYKLHELARPGSWDLDFSRPRAHVWSYVTERYRSAQQLGGFDFMRGDMAHVQMRPGGVPASVDDRYDILGAIKRRIADSCPWFGYFAESFLPARDVFQYGEELDHLDAAGADATLGDLQSEPVGSPRFLQCFRRYLDDAGSRACVPSFTVFTSDKDDPRFDECYRAGNEVRLFTAAFLVDMPSYTSLGFELRDVRYEPAENEHYTKLFVFEERGETNVFPSKARRSDTYVWGSNVGLFERIAHLRATADDVLGSLRDGWVRWLVPPDATGLRGTAAWALGSGSEVADALRFVCIVNFDLARATGPFGVPGLDPEQTLEPMYSTASGPDPQLTPVRHNGVFHLVPGIGPSEAHLYRISGRTG